MTLSPQPYKKPWLALADQIALLRQRGMIIEDVGVATEFLSHHNYFRFSGYCLAFEKTRHQFNPNVTFEHVRRAYEFDMILRDLVNEALEVIELDLRTVISYSFGQKYGPFGHTDCRNFFHHFRHHAWLSKLHEEAERSSELFIRHFKTTYADYPNLPIWVATETMSFGALSRMYSGTLRKDQKAVSMRYRLQPNILESWIHHFVYLRNLCAHHSRLWDRVWTIKPEFPAGNDWKPPLIPGNTQLFATLLILRTMLIHCPSQEEFAETWKKRAEDLLECLPDAPNANKRMDLTDNWKSTPVWERLRK